MKTGLVDLIAAFQSLGLKPPPHASPDISLNQIQGKLTNAALAKQLGGQRALVLIDQVEQCANLLDSFSESGAWGYVIRAQHLYHEMLSSLQPQPKGEIATIAAAIFNYFSFEQMVLARMRHGDRFTIEELMEYMLRRSSDAIMYASLLRLCDDINHPCLITGFRVRQALWDLSDDLEDLEQDRLTIGANLLLLTPSPKRKLRQLATSLRNSSLPLLKTLPLLQLAIDEQYHRICVALN